MHSQQVSTSLTKTVYHVSANGDHHKTGFAAKGGVFVFDHPDEARSFGNGWLEKKEKHLYSVEVPADHLTPDYEWAGIEEGDNPHAFVARSPIAAHCVKHIESRQGHERWD